MTNKNASNAGSTTETMLSLLFVPLRIKLTIPSTKGISHGSSIQTREYAGRKAITNPVEITMADEASKSWEVQTCHNKIKAVPITITKLAIINARDASNR